MTKGWILLAVVLVLAGCGGSGDSETQDINLAPVPVAPPTSVVVDQNDLFIHGKTNVSVGESVGLIVTASDRLDAVQTQWQQLSGPRVSMLSSHTQALSFDIPEAGNYAFTVEVQLADGQSRQAEITLSAQDNGEIYANTRLDHVAAEGGRVSFRLDTPDSKIAETIQWQLIQGPDAVSTRFQSDFTYENADSLAPHSLFFTAPRVSSDQVMRYQVNITYTDGTQAEDTVMALIDNTQVNDTGYFPDRIEQVVTGHMQPFKATSPYAEALLACVYNNTVSESCRFNRLPLLGMDTLTPSVEDVLDRTLVSHPWMGQRFEEYLRNSIAGPDMQNLLRGVTAIVISYDIRPSYYWAATGAIYLDANNFWRTPEERDTLNTAPDFRLDFGGNLRFSIPWRYVNDGQSYLQQAFPPISQRDGKSAEALEAGLSWLLYHELAHANDAFSPAKWASIPRTSSPLSYVTDDQNRLDSERMVELYPLISQELKDLARVSFAGDAATPTERDYLPADIEGFYEPDTAPAYYAYFTDQEDFATLFERFMMLYRYKIPADTAIVGRFDEPVQWAIRGRINTAALRSRLQFTVEQIFPELDFAAIQPTLPNPLQLPTDKTWSELLSHGVDGAPMASDHAQFGLPHLHPHGREMKKGAHRH